MRVKLGAGRLFSRLVIGPDGPVGALTLGVRASIRAAMHRANRQFAGLICRGSEIIR